jgi:ArsR family transcriptional regulator
MPTVSRHMAVLQQAGLVTSRKSGRWVYYRLADTVPGSPAAAALQWVFAALGEDATIVRDHDKLGRILACNPEDLCRQTRC